MSSYVVLYSKEECIELSKQRYAQDVSYEVSEEDYLVGLPDKIFDPDTQLIVEGTSPWYDEKGNVAVIFYIINDGIRKWLCPEWFIKSQIDTDELEMKGE